MLSSTIMCVCLAVLSLTFYAKTLHALVPLVCVNLYVFVFAIGFGPVPWIIMTEIFNPHAKTMAVSVVVAANWLCAFAAIKTFQNVLDLLGAGLTFAFYGLVCGVSAVFVAALVPETTNRNIREITRLLESDSPAFLDQEDKYTLLP